jgi:predicted dienelactone hydrolase
MVWYPADPNTINSSTPPAQYPLDPYTGTTYLPITLSTDWEPLGYDRAFEGLPPSKSGPFPLVVFSPGFDDDAWLHIFIGTRLASHGYVVAVADHYADCTWPWDPCDDFMTIMVNRPRDISFIISQLLIKSRTPRELLFHKIDPERIAASGHSVGGYATYAVTGRDDLVCDALWPAIVGQEALPYPSSTCVPTLPDRRIKAMISLDGSSQMLRYRELAKISVPSLIMGETVDQSTELGTLAGMPDPTQLRDWIARPHAAIHRVDSFRVDVNGANHYSFTNYCDAAQVFFNLGLISSAGRTNWLSSWPCANTGFDAVTISSADEHEVVTKYMIAFLDIYFHNTEPDHLVPELGILTPEYALTHTPTVEFFDSERCHATLPDDTYFTYRPYQVSSECDVAQKDPTGWFASQRKGSSNSAQMLLAPAPVGASRLLKKPFSPAPIRK